MSVLHFKRPNVGQASYVKENGNDPQILGLFCKKQEKSGFPSTWFSVYVLEELKKTEFTVV